MYLHKLQSRSVPSSAERRRSQRRQMSRVAKIQFGTGALPRDCLITDISEGGVRLHVEGIDVPDDFILLLSGDEIGAKFVGHVRRTGLHAVS